MEISQALKFFHLTLSFLVLIFTFFVKTGSSHQSTKKMMRISIAWKTAK